MSAVIDPGAMLNVAPATAGRPPNALRTSWTLRIGGGPGPASGTARDLQLLPPADEALRPEGHQYHEHEAHDDEAKRRHLLRRERPLDETGALEQCPEDDRASHHAAVAREATQHEDRVPEERERRLERARIEQVHFESQEVSRDRGDGGGESERLELAEEHILPHRSRRVLILADGPQEPAPWRAAQPLEEQEHAEEGHPDEDQEGKLDLVAQADRAEPRQHPVAHAPPVPLVAHQPLVPARELDVLGNVAYDLGERDRGDGEVVRTEPERGYAHQQAREDGRQRPHRQRGPE